MCVYIYICIFIYIYRYTYIHIYIQRERERDVYAAYIYIYRERHICIYIYIYIYVCMCIYIYIYIRTINCPSVYGEFSGHVLFKPMLAMLRFSAKARVRNHILPSHETSQGGLTIISTTYISTKTVETKSNT